MRFKFLFFGCFLSLGICAEASAKDIISADNNVPENNRSKTLDGFDIYEFSILGNSVLPVDNIEEVLKPYLGLDKKPEDVDEARAKLEEYYQQHGYKTVQVIIPKQTVKDGVIRLEVQESKIGRLEVVGSKYHSLDRIREQAQSLAQGNVPNFNEVSKDIQRLNSSSDRRVSPSIRAGETPGTIDVDLVVDDDLPVHGSIELNNRKSSDTSDLRASASLSYNNLWQRNHSLTLSYQTAPKNTDDSKVFYGSYLAPFEDSNFSLLLNAIRTDSNVSTIGGINVLGKGNIFGVKGIWSLRSTPDFYDSVSLGIDRKDFQQNINLEKNITLTPILYYPINATYNATKRGANSNISGDVGIVFALRQWTKKPPFTINGVSIDPDTQIPDSQQLSLRGNLEHLYFFKNGMQFQTRLHAQLTDQALESYEQFSAGGADSVRGYLESEAQGDLGINANFDLSSPSLFKSQDVRLYTFLDAATLKVKYPAAETPNNHDLASAGVGLKVSLWDHFEGNISWAKVLHDGPRSNAGDDRVLFRIFASF
jgi:hemolysin activation/secretion protein